MLCGIAVDTGSINYWPGSDTEFPCLPSKTAHAKERPKHATASTNSATFEGDAGAGPANVRGAKGNMHPLVPSSWKFTT